MSQNLAIYTIGQMLRVTCPNLLDMKIVTKLTTYRLYQSPDAFTDSQLPSIKVGRPSIKVGRPTILGGNRKLKCLLIKKLLFQRLGQIGSIRQQQTAVTGGQFTHHMQVVDIGRGQIKRLDHTERVDLKMQPKAIKGLATKLFTVAGETPKKLAAAGSGEPADRHRQAVQHHNRIRKILGHVFKELLFHRLQIRSLPQKTDSTTELGEVMAVKSFEKFEDVFVSVEPEDFADNFHCKYFAVSHLRRWASASKGPFWKEFFHKIISFTVDIYDKIIKVHFFALHGQWNNVLVYL